MPEKSLVGVWTLQSFAIVDDAERVLARPMGDRPKGFLIFTADGYMSVHIRSQTGITHERTPRAEPQSVVDAYDVETVGFTHDYLGYGGSYKLVNDCVINQVIVASVPVWIGTEQVRRFEQHGDTVTFYPPAVAGQTGLRIPCLTFTRLVPPSHAFAEEMSSGSREPCHEQRI